jgi:hypothetical protein
MVLTLDGLLGTEGLTASGALWAAALLVGVFVGSIAAVTFLIVQLPATCFTRNPAGWGDRHPAARWAWLILKNLLGVALVVAGVLMLVLPGQGILTILAGIGLLNFPGKRTLELKLLSRPGVLGAINRLRARFGKPPFPLEEQRGKPGDGRSDRLIKPDDAGLRGRGHARARGEETVEDG